jgi:hypothetical protein
MGQQTERLAGSYGLLANGTSRRWDVAIDEALDREGEWAAELEGPNVYLVLRLRDLQVITEAIRFLEESPEEGGTLSLGKFGASAASLEWDNEPPLRCFLAIGPKAKSTLRLCLDGEDVRMLREALRQVAADLPRATAQK